MRASAGVSALLTLLVSVALVVWIIGRSVGFSAADLSLVWGPLLATAATVSVALLLVAALGALGAASLNLDDAPTGREPLRYAVMASSAMSSIVVGVAALLIGKRLGLSEFLTMVLALVLLNVAPFTKALVTILDDTSRRFKEPALACGATSAYALMAAFMPASQRLHLAEVWHTAGKMAGQTAVLAVIAHTHLPLSVQMWHDAANGRLDGVQAVRAIVLIALLLSCKIAARTLRAGAVWERLA